MAHVHKLTEIKTMEPEVREKLAAMGIVSTDQFLERADTAAERNSLAKAIGIDAKQLTEWANRADLMRLNGVGYETANLLEECGVDSCKELRGRVAANLHAKLKSTNDEKQITHRAPTLEQIEAFIAEAKTITATAA